MRIHRTLALAFCLSGPLHAQINAALFSDPSPDLQAPASAEELAIPSHGEKLLGRILLASGARPHPTAIFLHGFPGFEQNDDLAQALRRSGWNVLSVHYRGAWGSGGTYSVTNSLEDAQAMADWVFAAPAKYRIDTSRVIVLGHSLGGFIGAQLMALNPRIAGGVLLAQANPQASPVFTGTTNPIDLAPLHGTSDAALRAETAANATSWAFSAQIPKIAPRPVLSISTDDEFYKMDEAFNDALKKAGDTKALHIHMATDHAFSTRRVAMTSVVIDWLSRFAKGQL